jgi:hypothetical protein
MTESADGPIRLEEDPATGDRFLVYGTDKGMRIDIRFEGETLWMSQSQIADLFGRDVGHVSRHITNILEEGELAEDSNLRNWRNDNIRKADVTISKNYLMETEIW